VSVDRHDQRAGEHGDRRGGRPVLAVVGATGAVGLVLCQLLSTRRDVWGEVRLVASRRSAGSTVRVRGEDLVVRELDAHVFDGVDVAVFDLPREVTALWAPIAAARGVVVVDGSGEYAAEDDVPLVVPGVNSAQVRTRPRGIVAVPGSAVMTVIDAISALHHGWGLTSVVLTTMQSASRAGQSGAERLYDELSVVASSRTLGQRPGDVRAALEEHLPGSSSPFPAPLALNTVPWVGHLEEGGWSSEEVAVRQQLRKVLGVPDLAVSATCVQVPVVTGHSVSVHATFQRQISVSAARQAIVEAPNVVLLDEPETGDFPTPVDAVGSDPTWVGRLRQPRDFPHALDLFVVGDNLRKGAALNTAEVGELVAAELAAGWGRSHPSG
jgi:aspartate-semialdehyde dehydrogenase